MKPAPAVTGTPGLRFKTLHTRMLLGMGNHSYFNINTKGISRYFIL